MDIIAVVTSPPKHPQRAEKGPRDWNTILSVADPNSWAMRDVDDSEWPRGEVQAQCFMGGKTGNGFLPVADIGDVILLREFGVVSRKGKVGLLNKGRGSGWCVWRCADMGSECRHKWLRQWISDRGDERSASRGRGGRKDGGVSTATLVGRRLRRGES